MTGRLTFGYLFDFRNPAPWQRPWSDFYAETLETISWLDDVGFGGVWVPEHHLASDGYMPSPLIALSAIAARTRNVRIGSAIALAPLYNPVRFATDCAVLDILAQGRLEMGLAIGYRRRETRAFGVDFTKRGKLFDEWLDIVTRLWAGETVDHAGAHFTIEGAQLMPPAPRGRIPLYIGGFAGKAMERVARHGDGYIGSDHVCGQYIEALRAQGKDPAAARIRVTGLSTVVALDPEKALDELAPHFLHFNNAYAAFFAEDQALGMDGMKPLTLEEFKASGELEILTPDAAIAKFRAMQERMPIDHFIMGVPPGLPQATFREYAQVFATHVLPAFR